LTIPIAVVFLWSVLSDEQLIYSQEDVQAEAVEGKSNCITLTLKMA
jgi:hypothetical protein